MLDAKMIRANPEAVDKILQKRGLTGALDKFLALDEKRRELLGKVEELKNFRNTSSQQVGQMKKAGEDPTELMEKVRQVGNDIKEMDDQIKEIEIGIDGIMLSIPNLPHE